MTMIEIHADSREQRSGIVDMLKKRADANVIDIQLAVGDFSVGGGIIIERKTAVDFIHSLDDGRFHGQIFNMKLNYTKPVVILEGDIFSTRSKFSKASLGGAMAWIHANGVSLIPSTSPEATAEIIYFMAKNAQVDMKAVPLRVKKPELTDKSAKYILEGLPAVAAIGSGNLLAHFGSIRAVMNATPEELAKVPRIGKATAQRIYDTINWQDPSFQAT